jgi:hypothetical protein
MSAADYFRQMKTLADTLAAIGQPLSEDDIIAYILAGLGPDYDSLVTTLTVRSDNLTLDEVYAHLLAYEHRNDLHESEYGLGASANFTRRGGGHSSGGGQGSHGNGNPSGGYSSGGGGRGNGGNRGRGRNGGGGGGRSQGRGNGGGTSSNNSGDDSRPICQICGKVGHAAIRCRRRFDHAFTGEEHSVNTASTSYNADPAWYMDTGATDHITNDLDRLQIRERYNGHEQVHVGNGAGLHISHVGSSSINTNANPLQLRNVLHVPRITKNLLSAHKLALDNEVFIEIHPYHFIVKATISVGGFKYYVSFVDDFSKFTWIYFLHAKSEVESVFYKFQKRVELLLDKKIKCVQSDWGGEYRRLHKYFNNTGIAHQVSCPHTHQQNGSIERKHRHIVETGLSLLAQAAMPVTFWDEAFSTATFLINRLPTRVIDNATPLERLLGTKAKPNYDMLKAFGCACFPHLRPYNAKKLTFRSKECVFIGYSEHHKGYKCLDRSTGRVYISRDVVFDETSFPFAKQFEVTLHPPNYDELRVSPGSGICINGTNDPQGPMHSRFAVLPAGCPPSVPRRAPDDHVARMDASAHVDRADTGGLGHAPGHASSGSLSLPPSGDSPASSSSATAAASSAQASPGSPSSPSSGDSPASSSSATADASSSAPSTSSSPAAPSPTATSGHPMVTRLRDQTWKPLKRTDGTVTYSAIRGADADGHAEPASTAAALRHPRWKEAMDAEFSALQRNSTWRLVPPRRGLNIIDSRWVFKVKRRPDGTVDRYKARLVAKGFKQRQTTMIPTALSSRPPLYVLSSPSP